MKRSFNIVRIFLSGLLLTSNVLAVLHLHEFYPADSHVHQRANWTLQVSETSGDLPFGSQTHQTISEDERTCPLHFTTQGYQVIASHVQSMENPVDVRFHLADSQVNWVILLSSKSKRAPPIIA